MKTDNNQGNVFKNNRSTIDKYKKSRTHQLNCRDCDEFYIGKTFINFKVRIDEHKRSFSYNKQDLSTIIPVIY